MSTISIDYSKLKFLTVGETQVRGSDHRDLIKVLERLQPKRLLEIGSFAGETAVVLGEWAKKTDGLCVCVDPWDVGILNADGLTAAMANDIKSGDVEMAFHQNIINNGLTDWVVTIKGFFSEVIDKVEKYKPFDFVYVDADHRYQNVYLDLSHVIHRIQPQIAVGGHDMERRWESLSKKEQEDASNHFNEDFVKNFHPGVSKAVHDFFGDDYENYGRIWFKDLRK